VTLKSTCLFCALVALFAIPAFCTVITFNSQSSWQSATTGDSTPIGFDGIATVGSPASFNTTTGLVIGGVDFIGWTSATSAQTIVYDPSLNQPFFDFGTGSILSWNANNGLTGAYPYLEVILPQAVNAVGMNIMAGTGSVFQVGLNNAIFAYTSGATTGWPVPNFFGLTSDTPFTTFYLQLPGGNTPFIDNFSYGSEQTQGGGGGGGSDPTDTPEVATFLMIATGLIALSKGRRVIHRAVAA
jgi:hypothetical protein